MPVIPAPADYARWLGEEAASAEDLGALLRPYPAEPMLVYPIGQRIGSVRNEGPELIGPVGLVLSMVD
jgi:putative SOS response-associated peptidase YedK